MLSFCSKLSFSVQRKIIGNRSRINVFCNNEPGILTRILSVFHFNKVTLTNLSAKLLNVDTKGNHGAYFALDFEGSETDPATIKILQELNLFSVASQEWEIPEVNPFPSKLADLDSYGNLIDTSTQEGNKDYPGFTDPEYLERRKYIANLGKEYKMGQPIPRVKYSCLEDNTWKYIWNILRPLQVKYMCRQFNDNFEKLEKAKIYSKEKIPQLDDVNRFLKNETGFQIKPVSGILTQREFLDCLGMRVFCSTQYIRHHSSPEYTPEPDIIHELMGHVPMFADPSFCDLSQQIGLLSLGNSDENIILLSTLYWYTVEFGACRQENEIKGYGAGIASSIGEIKNFASAPPKCFQPLNPFAGLNTNYPIQTVQPIYYVADSFKNACEILIKYGDFLPKPFQAYYDMNKQEVNVNRKVIWKSKS